MMAIAIKEREEMFIAQQLKQDGWVHDLYDLQVRDCRERANWCRETFGPMHGHWNTMTYSDEGKWFGAELPFQSGGVTPKRQFVFMFRDEKLYTMFKIMFPE